MNEKQEISVNEFIKMIYQSEEEQNLEMLSNQTPEIYLKNKLEEGRRLGWIEEQDIIDGGRSLDMRTCARLLHMYRKLVLGIKDAADITPAYDIKDLFDCRVCANHIAQMVIQGIMAPVLLGNIKIFDVYRTVTVEEAIVFIKNAGDGKWT